jgi:hypothetical protein
MKRFILILALITVTALAVSGLQAEPRDAVRPGIDKATMLTRIIQDFYGISSSHSESLYLGSEMCLACHSGDHAIGGYDTARYRNTLHARPYKDVADDPYTMLTGMGVICDANKNGIDDFIDGLDFNADDQTAFESYKPNAPVLSYSDATGYVMTIGEGSFKIFFAWGGNNMPAKQRYVVKIPVTDRPTGLSAGAYVSPLQYNEKTKEWVPYHPENWYNEDASPIFGPSTDSPTVAEKGRSFDKRCAGCHFTGTSIMQDSFGEFVASAAPATLLDPDDPTYIDFNGDGIKEQTHIGCEGCHGPGSLHVIQHGNPDKIFNPKKADYQAANELCGNCHVRGSSSDGTYGYPWDEANDQGPIPGAPLDDFLTPNPGLWPDGKNPKQHHQQFHDLYQSSKPEFAFHHVTCYECHGAHIDTKHQVVEMIEDGDLVIPTENDNNSLCLACHATHGPFADITKEMVADLEDNADEIGMVVAGHTNHPYGPDRKMGLGRCSKCHMPKVAKSAINYDIHSHTFEAIPPEKTLMYQEEGGMPSSCSVSCHRNIADIFPNGVDGSISDWTEDSDVSLAEWLVTYYGPGGKWWDTEHEEGGDEH